MSTLFRIIKRFIRIYTPFICSVASYFNGKDYVNNVVDEGYIYVSSATMGFSLLLVAYMFVTSLRMCIWSKLNLLCLALIQIIGLIKYYFDITIDYYVAVVNLSTIGIIFFLVFRLLYVVTDQFSCNRRY